MIDAESDDIERLDYGYMLKKLEEMVRIPSVVGEEKELAHYLKAELDSLGLETELHEVHPGRPNVYAKMRGSKPGRRLHFNGHPDTVPGVEGGGPGPLTPVGTGGGS